MTADTTDPAAPSGTAAPARKKASDFHPRILEIFDGYVHGKLTKRQFMEQAGKYAAAGQGRLPRLRPRRAEPAGRLSRQR